MLAILFSVFYAQERWNTIKNISNISSIAFRRTNLVYPSNYIISHDNVEENPELPVYKIIGILILCLLTLTMILVNILSICTIATSKALMQSSYYNFVLNLAAVDLAIGLFIMPVYIIWEYNTVWPFDKISCDLVTVADIAFSDVSTYTLVLVALDKYIYITQPFLYHEKLTLRKARIMITVVWVIWISYGVVSIYGDVALDEQSRLLSADSCIFIMKDIYIGVTACVTFLIPFVILSYCGIRIYFIAHKHLRKISRCHPVPPSIDTATFIDHQTPSSPTINDCPSTAQAKQNQSIQLTEIRQRPSEFSIASEINKKKRTSLCKPFGTVVIVIFFFLMMCAPYWVATGADIFCHCIEPWIYEDVLAVIYNLNSLVNPFIYITTDRKYRAAVRKFLSRCFNSLCCRNRPVNNDNVPESCSINQG